MTFQSTHPVWDATSAWRFPGHSFPISIHASRVGCDQPVLSFSWTTMMISIHASRVGCDCVLTLVMSSWIDFNPRIPCGMRRQEQVRSRFQQISIHASRVGCDRSLCTPASAIAISIHASRVGCDCTDFPECKILRYFNPRIPCGMRRGFTYKTTLFWEFQSTHPVWDATVPIFQSVKSCDISIHASRVGCDGGSHTRRRCSGNFNPRIPCGMRLLPKMSTASPDISIHASRVGCDITFFQQVLSCLFQSTHPVWDATTFQPLDS